MSNTFEGVIVKLLSGYYYCATDSGEIVCCRARGIFRKDGMSPLVGDNVRFVKSAGDGSVIEILPRKNRLVRPAAANIDRIVIVSAHSVPSPNTLIIDRMTAIAHKNNIECVIVFNKADLGNMSNYRDIYSSAGFKTFIVSADTGEGIDELKEYLSNGFNVFTGNTGVGKSSILNRIIGEDIIKTGEVSEKLGRGRHTTRHIEIYPICNGAYAADTPGFSSLTFEDAEFISKDEMILCFPDINKYNTGCRFVSCSHINEPDCVVKTALNNGLINPSRYESYCAMYNEVKDIKDWERKKRK